MRGGSERRGACLCLPHHRSLFLPLRLRLRRRARGGARGVRVARRRAGGGGDARRLRLRHPPHRRLVVLARRDVHLYVGLHERHRARVIGLDLDATQRVRSRVKSLRVIARGKRVRDDDFVADAERAPPGHRRFQQRAQVDAGFRGEFALEVLRLGLKLAVRAAREATIRHAHVHDARGGGDLYDRVVARSRRRAVGRKSFRRARDLIVRRGAPRRPRGAHPELPEHSGGQSHRALDAVESEDGDVRASSRAFVSRSRGSRRRFEIARDLEKQVPPVGRRRACALQGSPRGRREHHLVVRPVSDALHDGGVASHAGKTRFPRNTLVVRQDAFSRRAFLRLAHPRLVAFLLFDIVPLATVRLSDRRRATLRGLAPLQISLALLLLAFELVRGALQEHVPAERDEI